MRVTKTLIAAFAIVCLMSGSAIADKQIVITFAGDCTIGCEERLMWADYSFATYAKQKGYAYFLAKMKPLFSQDDLTVVNFEGVLKDNDYGKANKTYCFRGLPEYTQVLTLGDVEVVNLANNHTGDYGDMGRASTQEALKAAGIATFNADDAYIFEKDGIRIAFYGISRTAYFAKKKVYKQAIQKLRDDGADVVVCFMHFGREYTYRHDKAQTEMSRTMIDAGADLVIGSHPHVVQGIEVYNGAYILYSMGNFVFGGNAKVRANECIVPRVTLTFDDSGAYLGQQMRIYPANISGDAEQNDYQPRLVQGEAAEAVYKILDADSEGQPDPTAQTDEYRDYAYVLSQKTGVVQ